MNTLKNLKIQKKILSGSVLIPVCMSNGKMSGIKVGSQVVSMERLIPVTMNPLAEAI